MSKKAKYSSSTSSGRKISGATRARTANPLTGSVVVSGKVAGSRYATFRFSIVSPAMQLRERNKAYQYFQID